MLFSTGTDPLLPVAFDATFSLTYSFIDWASDLVTNDVPKSTSETRGDADESPPPLPSKNRAIHEEANTLPRSSKVMSPTETGSVANENNNSFEKPVALPRLKTISGGQVKATRICICENLRLVVSNLISEVNMWI